MFVNLTSLEEGAHAEFCVIGSGPAGMTVARKLAAAGRKVFLFEGGGEEISEESQNIYKGKIVKGDYFPLDVCRLRYLGGSSNHWSGFCNSMPSEVFEGYRDMPMSAWPIEKSDLDPYASEAQNILDINLRTDRSFDSYFFKRGNHRSPPTRFKEKYYEELKNSQNLFVFLNSNLVALNTNAERIVSTSFTNYDNISRVVRADNYILATGAIENSRILLYNNIREKNFLVKSSNMLGKYFMEHPIDRSAGVLTLTPSVEKNPIFQGTFSLHRKIRESLDILNFSITHKPISDFLKNNLQHELQILTHIESNIKFLNLFIFSEMLPRYENAITLGESKDRFGIPISNLSLTLSQKEYRTKEIFCKFLGQHFINKNLGRIKISSHVLNHEIGKEPGWGYHHMGGTRMAQTSETGVVNKNCLVFGQKNLYIAGSSVFPSGGPVVPTYTIVQLALRLSDHLLALRA